MCSCSTARVEPGPLSATQALSLAPTFIASVRPLSAAKKSTFSCLYSSAPASRESALCRSASMASARAPLESTFGLGMQPTNHVSARVLALSLPPPLVNALTTLLAAASGFPPLSTVRLRATTSTFSLRAARCSLALIRPHSKNQCDVLQNPRPHLHAIAFALVARSPSKYDSSPTRSRRICAAWRVRFLMASPLPHLSSQHMESLHIDLWDLPRITAWIWRVALSAAQAKGLLSNANVKLACLRAGL